MNLHIDNDTCHEIIYTQGGVSHSLDKLYYNEHLVWQKLTPDPYATQYFTIESLEDNNSITLKKNGNAPSITLYYSTDNGATWTEHATSTEKTWGVNTGDKILLKANALRYCDGNYSNFWSFIGTKTHVVYGNVMSLFYGDNFAGQTTFKPNSSSCLSKIFAYDTYLVSAEHLLLPATTLVPWCYHQMFRECTSLTTGPKLPATTLESYCYTGMFYGCTALTSAPELTVATLTSGCYNGLFQGCSSLKKIICLATDITAFDCTSNWVDGVSATGDFYKDASMSSWTTGTAGIPSGWTVNNYS